MVAILGYLRAIDRTLIIKQNIKKPGLPGFFIAELAEFNRHQMCWL